MIAATLGPVASAFSTCALVQKWRRCIPPGKDINQAGQIPDPVWLTVINAIQLAIAVISNVFLLLNMTRRVRFSVAQPITIVGWYLSAMLLLGLTATASGPLAKESNCVWSGAFYYGIFAAILYFIVASLMVVTVWGAQAGHYDKDFKLSTSQRTLMLQTISFLMYLLLGALVFSKIEGWDYLDAVYWADVTLFTVGYGDLSPGSTLGRALLIPYALVGVTSLGLVIGSIRSLMLDRGKRRLDARMLEKERRQLIRQMRRKGKEGVLQPVDTHHHGLSETEQEEPWPLAELQRRQKEFMLMRKIQNRASTRKRWTELGLSFSTWLVLWLVGAKIFQECEEPYQHWSYFDAFYFCFTGLTTIGYGDLTPISYAGKAFFVFWSLLALPTMTVLISNAGDTIVRWVRDGTLRLGNITILPGEGGIRNEFSSLMRRLSMGEASKEEDIEERPPGFLGAVRRAEAESGGLNDGGDTELGEVATTNGGAPTASPSERAKAEEASGPEATQSSGLQPPRLGTAPTVGTDASQKALSFQDSSSTAIHQDKTPRLEQADSFPRDDIPTQLPKTRAEYHLVLIDEIARVTQHLQHKPPRRYTFREWAWYLRLIGEDESRPETHRRAAHKPKKAHRLPKEGRPEGDDDETKWSWVGHKSPLMDTREEAEWILDRLEQKLREELQAVVREAQGEGRAGKVRKEMPFHDGQTSSNEVGAAGS